MSRSLHTDPYPLRAARRIAAPHRRRADEPRVTRRSVPYGAGDTAARVEVRVCRPRPGFSHPAGVDAITRLLAFFGPAAVYGLRRIELRQSVGRPGPGLRVAGLMVPGVVVLFEQPDPPWILPGRWTDDSSRRLRRAGAHVHATAAGTRIEWPGGALRDFVLFDGLMHEIGHHMLQRVRGKHPVPAMRTADHERRADAFAASCRRAWNTWTTGVATW